MNNMEQLRNTRKILLSAALLAVSGISSTQADQVINDDVIVDGSLCVGLDCVQNQEFGFSTQILKENNLRIFFDDTSTTASFPANDWEIIANDSANGGASYLGIADRLAGQASVSGEGVCSGGTNDGLVCGDIPENNCLGICDGGTFDGFPCSNDASCDGGMCVGAGTCVAPGAVVFLIEAGAPADSLKIDSSGLVGLGTAAPAAELDVNGDAIVRGNLTVTGTIGGGTGVTQMCPEKEFVIGVEADGTIICSKKSK